MRRLAISLAGLLLGGGCWIYAAHGGGHAPDPQGSYGFVLTDFSTALFKNRDAIDCPDGPSDIVRDGYLATQTPAERLRLQRPENAEEFNKKYKVDYIHRPDGKNVCTNPEVFDHAPQRLVQSKMAYGLDLDGNDGSKPASADTCPHQNFQGPGGEAGVDNQYYRAIACNLFWRGKEGGVGDSIAAAKQGRATSGQAYVLMVRGVDDWRNDDNVEVTIASTPDTPSTDNAKAILAGGSLTLSDDPRWRNVGRGRIHDGVLTTDPMDIRLPSMWNTTPGSIYLKRARLRLEVLPTGELKGIAAGYQPLENLYGSTRQSGYALAAAVGVDCASIYKTLKSVADGDRDPRTGQCTSLSTAFDVAASPAYLFDKGDVLVANRVGRRLTVSDRR